jgi:hypothetical protein
MYVVLYNNEQVVGYLMHQVFGFGRKVLSANDITIEEFGYKTINTYPSFNCTLCLIVMSPPGSLCNFETTPTG